MTAHVLSKEVHGLIVFIGYPRLPGDLRMKRKVTALLVSDALCIKLEVLLPEVKSVEMILVAANQRAPAATNKHSTSVRYINASVG